MIKFKGFEYHAPRVDFEGGLVRLYDFAGREISHDLRYGLNGAQEGMFLPKIQFGFTPALRGRFILDPMVAYDFDSILSEETLHQMFENFKTAKFGDFEAKTDPAFKFISKDRIGRVFVHKNSPYYCEDYLIYKTHPFGDVFAGFGGIDGKGFHRIDRSEQEVQVEDLGDTIKVVMYLPKERHDVRGV